MKPVKHIPPSSEAMSYWATAVFFLESQLQGQIPRMLPEGPAVARSAQIGQDLCMWQSWLTEIMKAISALGKRSKQIIDYNMLLLKTV